MDRRAKGIIAALAATVIVLAVALVAVIVTNTDDSEDDGMMTGAAASGSYMGMMQAMGSMDSDAMLTHMREVLGEDGYQEMLQHLSAHRSGGPMTSTPKIDTLMHQMMDGMMQQMPDDSGHMMPMMSGTATGTATASH